MGQEHDRVCFVVMPFGRKKVSFPARPEGKWVDFDAIYEDIFEKAIRKVRLPEGGRIEPRRTDHDFYSADIGQEMFEYLEYSRIVIADLTGLNPNVFYELGVRHRAREAGTILFRQAEAAIPFDVNQIKAFPYEYRPERNAAAARKLVARVLAGTLEKVRLDSPVRRALRAQSARGDRLEQSLHQAENCVRRRDPAGAVDLYVEAIAETRTGRPDQAGASALTHFKLGLLLKEQGKWDQAVQSFETVLSALPRYAEAHRELGIARNKVSADKGALPGAVELRKAIRLNASDFDALSSLGGIYKRAGLGETRPGPSRKLLSKSAALYRKAVEISLGSPYPLLNALKIEARIHGEVALSTADKAYIAKAERGLLAQVRSEPPANPPWSHFDLAEIKLFQRRKNAFLDLVADGLRWATAPWQVETFRSSLRLLPENSLPGLAEGLALLDKARQAPGALSSL